PHGPLAQADTSLAEVLDAFIPRLRQEARQRGASFIRVSPLVERTEENAKVFATAGFRPAPIYMHAENTWMLSLESSKEELLAGMRKTTRNWGRRAEEEGVAVKREADEDAFSAFGGPYTETADKHGFTPFPMKFVRAEHEIFAGSDG